MHLLKLITDNSLNPRTAALYMISLQGQEKYTRYETALILLPKYTFIWLKINPLSFGHRVIVSPLEHCQELHFQFLPGG